MRNPPPEKEKESSVLSATLAKCLAARFALKQLIPAFRPQFHCQIIKGSQIEVD